MGCSPSNSSQALGVVCPEADGFSSGCVRLESFATADGKRARTGSGGLPRISIDEADAASKPPTAGSARGRSSVRALESRAKSSASAAGRAGAATAYCPPPFTARTSGHMQWLDLPSPKRKSGKRFSRTLWFLESAGFSLCRPNRIAQVRLREASHFDERWDWEDEDWLVSWVKDLSVRTAAGAVLRGRRGREARGDRRPHAGAREHSQRGQWGRAARDGCRGADQCAVYAVAARLQCQPARGARRALASLVAGGLVAEH